tara:strand:+ start:308 stop:658 length:351 start_codon:yes stop_codon:yes gene_type:complete
MWVCNASEFCFRVKGMPFESKKGEEKKAIILVWRWVNGFLAYVYEALWDVLSTSADSSSSSSHSAFEKEQVYLNDPEDCKHGDSEYLWDGVSQDTDRWECHDCGQVLDEEDEPYFL